MLQCQMLVVLFRWIFQQPHRHGFCVETYVVLLVYYCIPLGYVPVVCFIFTLARVIVCPTVCWSTTTLCLWLLWEPIRQWCFLCKHSPNCPTTWQLPISSGCLLKLFSVCWDWRVTSNGANKHNHISLLLAFSPVAWYIDWPKWLQSQILQLPSHSLLQLQLTKCKL